MHGDHFILMSTKTLDLYGAGIRQVATLLGYWRTSNFRSIQKHTSYKTIFGSIPYRRLKASSKTAKRILTKEKIDRQLACQSSSTPFMSIKDSYNNKKVTFDTQDWLEDKIDKQ